MKYKSKIVFIFVATIMSLFLAACGNGNDHEASGDEESSAAVEETARADRNPADMARQESAAASGRAPESAESVDTEESDDEQKELTVDEVKQELLAKDQKGALGYGKSLLKSREGREVLREAAESMISDARDIASEKHDKQASITRLEDSMQLTRTAYLVLAELLYEGEGNCAGRDRALHGVAKLCREAVGVNIGASDTLEDIYRQRAESAFTDGRALVLEQGIEPARPKLDSAIDNAGRAEEVHTENEPMRNLNAQFGGPAARGNRNGSFWERGDSQDEEGNGEQSYSEKMRQRVERLVSLAEDPDALEATRKWQAAQTSDRNLANGEAIEEFYKAALINGGQIDDLPDLMKACVVLADHEAFANLEDEFARHSLMEALPEALDAAKEKIQNNGEAWHIFVPVRLDEYDFDRNEFPMSDVMVRGVSPSRITTCFNRLHRYDVRIRREIGAEKSREIHFQLAIEGLEEAPMELSLPPQVARNVDKSSVELLVTTGSPVQSREGTKVQALEIIRSYKKKGSGNRVYEIIYGD